MWPELPMDSTLNTEQLVEITSGQDFAAYCPDGVPAVSLLAP